jgi:hypothetical protein
MDTIIKKISVRANYNELIFDNSMAGFDYLDVSRRSFQRIDFRLTDSYGNTINFKKSHWSLSIIFQRKNYFKNTPKRFGVRYFVLYELLRNVPEQIYDLLGNVAQQVINSRTYFINQ